MRHRVRRLQVPGVPRWVGYYRWDRVQGPGGTASYQAVECLCPVRLRVWRAARWARREAATLAGSLYERRPRDEGDPVWDADVAAVTRS